ncbi:MAG: hypothetical protein LiPW41_104 [Parcubacteria group bacterium LiPW_41]|nr:MAG: hypothetical protein LiPW41_104 [Parcubacteria group bacterium LiPW_41]
MADRSKKEKAKQVSSFVSSIVIPTLIAYEPWQRDKFWETMEQEAWINALVNSQQGTFEELVGRAKDSKFVYHSLDQEEIGYFPHKSDGLKKYQVRLFLLSEGLNSRESKMKREMESLGYRHGTGCELLHLVFEKCFQGNDIEVVAKGSFAKPDKKEGIISPMATFCKDKKTYLSIHDHGVYGSPTPLYCLGVKNKTN